MWKKIVFSSCVLSLATIFAQDFDEYEEDEVADASGVEEFLAEEDFLADSSDTDSTSSMPSSQASSAKPSVDFTQTHGGYASASFLYWKNMQSNLSYAITETPPSNATGGTLDDAEVTIIGDYETVKYDWNYGFKVAAGYRFGATNWDLSAQYTYFFDSGSASLSRNPDGQTAPQHYIVGLFEEFFGSSINKITSKVDMHYNVADLVLQRAIYQTPSFVLRILMGGRGASITQDWHTKYYYTADVRLPLSTVKNDWNFQGGGLRAGFNMDWYWGWGFKMRFLAAASSVLGYFNNKHSNIESDFDTGFDEENPDDQYILANINPKSHRIINTFEMSTGVERRKAWDMLALAIFADWEMNQWIDLNQTYFYPANAYDGAKVGSWTRDSVNLQGLTLGVRFEF